MGSPPGSSRRRRSANPLEPKAESPPGSSRRRPSANPPKPEAEPPEPNRTCRSGSPPEPKAESPPGSGRRRRNGNRSKPGSRAGTESDVPEQRIGPSQRPSHRRSRIGRAGTGTGPGQASGPRPGALVRRGRQRGSALAGRLRDICDLRPRRDRCGGCGGYGEHDRRHHDHRERDPTRGESADPPSQNVMRPSTVKPHQNPLPTQFPGFDLFRGAQDQLTPVAYPDRRNLTGDLDKHLSCQSQRSSPIPHRENTKR